MQGCCYRSVPPLLTHLEISHDASGVADGPQKQTAQQILQLESMKTSVYESR